MENRWTFEKYLRLNEYNKPKWNANSALRFSIQLAITPTSHPSLHHFVFPRDQLSSFRRCLNFVIIREPCATIIHRYFLCYTLFSFCVFSPKSYASWWHWLFSIRTRYLQISCPYAKRPVSSFSQLSWLIKNRSCQLNS